MKKKPDIECLNCGKLFHPTRKGTKFCCRACGIEYNTIHGKYKKTDEQKEKLSKAKMGKEPWNKGKKASPEAIAKFRENIKTVWTEEKREEQRQKQKEVWSNPELLEKHSETMFICYNKEDITQKVYDVLSEYNIELEEEYKNNIIDSVLKAKHITNVDLQKVYILLLTKFMDVKTQYKVDDCDYIHDFYIPELSLYIECYFDWIHGGKPFKNDFEDKQYLTWVKKSKTSDKYKQALYTWTDLDIKKIRYFIENGLKYKVFYTYDEFLYWLNNDLNKKPKSSDPNYKKEYYATHKEEAKEWYRNRSEEQKKAKAEYNRKWKNKEYTNSISYKLRCIMSSGVRRSLNNKKESSIFKLLPYTFEELRAHLEAQFEDWMTWDNLGSTADKPKVTWQIDHIKPVNTFNITDEHCEEFRKCWALENLRPLDSFINVSRPKDGSDIK